MTTTIDVRRTGRARAAWAAAHGAVPGVARWERIAARVVPLTLLPSSLWRIAACTFHAPIVRGGTDIGATPSNVPGLSIEAYAVLLSIVSELLGFAAVGLSPRGDRPCRDGFRGSAAAGCPGWSPSFRPRSERAC